MKRVLLAAALLAQIATSAGDVYAQSEEPQYLRLPHRFHIFFEGGGALPYSPGVWNDQWNASFELGIGAGLSIFPWLEVNAGLARTSYGVNKMESKTVLRYQGIGAIEGGSISTQVFYGSARFIAVPKSRTNPFVEAAVGYFKTTADDLVIEDDPAFKLQNSMKDASGLSIAPSAGIQYALGDHWTAYTRFTYMVNFSDSFDPGSLLTPRGETREASGGDQIIETISVGVFLRF